MTQLFAPENSCLSRVTSLLDEISNEKTAASQISVAPTPATPAAAPRTVPTPGPTASQKTAAAKKASEMGTSGQGSKDPGGYARFGGGPSTHPSAKVDSNTQAAPMGSRAKENEADVKEDHPGAGVDNTSPNSGGDQDSHQYNIGTQQSATGEQPSVEDHYKGDKEDPGTASPANADDIGEKYGSMDFEPLCKLAFDSADALLADLARGMKLGDPTVKAGEANAKLAQAAGAELANAPSDAEKRAFAHELIAHHIKDAHADADLVGQYLTIYAAEQTKLASQQFQPQPTTVKRADPMGGMMDGPPPDGAPPDAGGGMPPEAGGGGMPPAPGGPGGEGGPGGGVANELANVLMELGIPPDQLIAALQQAAGGAGGGGGMPPEAGGGMPPEAGGGMPPEAGGGMPGGAEKGGSAQISKADAEAVIKLASEVKNLYRAGKVQLKEATGQMRVERDEVKNFIREVCSAR